MTEMQCKCLFGLYGNNVRRTCILFLTMRCWKSQERIMFVACLGRTPRLFLDFLSSPSKSEDKSRFTLEEREKRDEKVSGGEGGIVATETKRVASHHFFGRGRNAFSHHSNAMGVMIPKIKAKEGTFTESFHQLKELQKML